MNSTVFATEPSRSRSTRAPKSRREDAARFSGIDEAETTVQPRRKPVAQAADSARREVVFHFDSDTAKEVWVVGDFSDWERTPIKMRRTQAGEWEAAVPLPPGRHGYRFLVDGEWQNDPNCAESRVNPFGTWDNVVEV